MLGTAGLNSRPFASGADFLESFSELDAGCILLDIRMPEIDGFAVMAELVSRGVDWPVTISGPGSRSCSPPWPSPPSPRSTSPPTVASA